ncbi:MAG: hypothetical protein ACJ786_13735, partial [Catenulispora sp.]
MELVLVGVQVRVQELDRLVDQVQGGRQVAPVQLDQGAGVAHERAVEGVPLRGRGALGQGQRRIDPRQCLVLVEPRGLQVPGVDHRHHVGAVHLLFDLGGDP